MAYERTTWVSGETPVSADNMNNIEDGIEELNDKISVKHYSTSNCFQQTGAMDSVGGETYVFGNVVVMFLAISSVQIGANESLLLGNFIKLPPANEINVFASVSPQTSSASAVRLYKAPNSTQLTAYALNAVNSTLRVTLTYITTDTNI